MKKTILILLAALSLKCFSQSTAIDSARTYVNSNINTNGIRSITGTKMNNSLNLVLDAIEEKKGLVDGFEFVTTSRNFSSSDLNKLLVMYNPSDSLLTLTIPDSIIFDKAGYDKIAITTIGRCAYQTNYGGKFIYPKSQDAENKAETIVYYTFPDDSGRTILVDFQNGTMADGDTTKTTLNYLLGKIDPANLAGSGLTHYLGKLLVYGPLKYPVVWENATQQLYSFDTLGNFSLRHNRRLSDTTEMLPMYYDYPDDTTWYYADGYTPGLGLGCDARGYSTSLDKLFAKDGQRFKILHDEYLNGVEEPLCTDYTPGVYQINLKDVPSIPDNYRITKVTAILRGVQVDATGTSAIGAISVNGSYVYGTTPYGDYTPLSAEFADTGGNDTIIKVSGMVEPGVTVDSVYLVIAYLSLAEGNTLEIDDVVFSYELAPMDSIILYARGPDGTVMEYSQITRKDFYKENGEMYTDRYVNSFGNHSLSFTHYTGLNGAGPSSGFYINPFGINHQVSSGLKATAISQSDTTLSLQSIDSVSITGVTLTPTKFVLMAPHWIEESAGACLVKLADDGIGYKKIIIGGNHSDVLSAETVTTVTIPEQTDTSYQAIVTATNAAAASQLYYIANKTTTSFDVTFTSNITGTVTFDYIIKPAY